jgi:hypothetical protein
LVRFCYGLGGEWGLWGEGEGDRCRGCEAFQVLGWGETTLKVGLKLGDDNGEEDDNHRCMAWRVRRVESGPKAPALGADHPRQEWLARRA